MTLHRIDVESNLKIFYPAIFKFLGNRRINWRKISINFELLLDRRRNEVINSETGIILSELCLLDLITQRVLNNPKSIHLSELFNAILENLLNHTDEKERQWLSNTIYNSLINFDRRYLNFVGELAVLNILKDLGYYLERTEYPLTNIKDAKSIDFQLTKDGQTRLLEVVNIHISSEKALTKESIKILFDSKVKNKFIDKKKNTESKFSLAPVIWSDFETLKIINDFFEIDEYADVLFPFAYMGYDLRDSNQSKVMFGSLNKVLNA